MTYYIDPGTTKGCAVASFGTRGNHGPAILIGLGFWSEQDGFVATWGVHANWGAVWECPQVYPRKGGRVTEQEWIAKANAAVAVAAAGSACANVLGWGRGGVRSVLPREWKRQLPKPQHHAHALTLLTAPERALVNEAYQSTRARSLDPKDAGASLDLYVRAGCLHVARNPGKGLAKYSAKITDLLDAVTLGLTEEGRLVL